MSAGLLVPKLLMGCRQPSAPPGGGLAITAYSQVVNWFATDASKTAAATWQTGDIIIVAGGSENGNTTLGNPSATGLTFGSPKISITTGADQECPAYIWGAQAASPGSAVNISITRAGFAQHWGFGAWVVEGGPSGFGNTFANRNESVTALSCTAGSIVFIIVLDWNANQTTQTLATGSGTATKRQDAGNGASYGMILGEWVDIATTASYNFGLVSYSGLKASSAGLEVLL